jgi:hypothetical protein
VLVDDASDVDVASNTISIGGRCGTAIGVTNGVTVPAGIGTITAVVMNVTVTDPTAGGDVTVYPDGGRRAAG